MRKTGKTLVLAALLALIVIAVMEGMLAVLAAVSPRVDALLAAPWAPPRVPLTLADDRLGHRLNPEHRANDARGYANPRALETAEIVTLGDSQTHPTNIPADQAWPRRLAELSGETLYSLAVPGYGPVHFLIQFPEALAMHPRTIAVAFYAGNDCYDAFDMVHDRGQFPDLAATDPTLRAAVDSAEAVETIAAKVARAYAMGGEGTPAEHEATAAPAGNPIARYSKIYALLRRTRFEIPRFFEDHDPWHHAVAFAQANPEYCQVFDGGEFRTLFTPTYRMLALDLDDPRIEEGLEISLRAYQRMHEMAAAEGSRFIVVLIPNKEMVFAELWQDPSDEFRVLIDNETRFWETTKRFFDENGIEYADALPALRGRLARGIQPYRVSQDGHPIGEGHLAIAEAVYARMQQLGE